MLRACACSLLLVIGVTSPAMAQTAARGNNIQLFNPTPGPKGFFSREYGEVGYHLEPYAALWLNYARAPLVRFRLNADGTTTFDREVVSHQLAVDVVGALALFEILEIGVGIPFTPFQSGAGLPATPTEPAQALANVTFGDLRLQPKVQFLNTEHVHLGAAVMLTFPTGSKANFTGEQTVTGVPRLMANFRAVEDRFNTGIDVGIRLRAPATLDNIVFGHELVWGAHLSYEIVKNLLTAGVEIYGAMGFPKARADGVSRISLDEAPIDALAGLKIRAGWFLINVGAGTGITTGYGAPQFRVLAGLAFSPQKKKKPEPASQPEPEPVIIEPVPAPAPPPPPPPPIEPKVEITREKIAINDKVYFEFDSDKINALSFPLLDKVVEIIKKNPRLRLIRIDGHTDNVGTDSYNIDLSTRRAFSVLRYLTSHGVAGSRLKSEGYGFRKPKTSNSTPRGRAINRRVEFIIELQELDPDEMVPEKPSFDEDAAVRESPP
ncbi:MAG: OmpA family protein [Deltaproteobacteria bacterium]|nr:OmpA family protein [Deltaproteobacteria bacterium]